MADGILFLSSSLSLLISSCIALVLGLFFRIRSRRLNRVANNPSVNEFDRTFNVFNPYPDRSKLINSFLTVFPLVVFACTGVALLIFVEIVATGLLLSLIIMILSVNLLVVEGAFEVYQSARTFVLAFQNGKGLGWGDLRVLQIVKNALPRLGNYYFGLAITFAIFNLTLPYTVPFLWWFFVQLMDLAFRSGGAMGFPPFTVPLMWILSVTVITIFVRKLKNRFSRSIFSYASGL